MPKSCTGFFGGLTLLLLGACAPVYADSAPTATPSPTATATLTPTSTPTVTPTPTLTPTPAGDGACFVSHLWPGQTISASGSFTQTETEAAGPMICRIERDSCAFRQMVGLLNPMIVFKKEEEPPFDREDIMMHPAMLLPLDRLNKLVLAEWNGEVQLRVTDAYDSLLEHDLSQTDETLKYSLHFEGRSVDLTTWPIDKTRYARLCALAQCAGFAWVENEEDHCHASIKAESLCHQCR